MNLDEKFMKSALCEARKAYENQEVPVGCVVVLNGKIIGRGYNKKETKHCSVYHAEIVALQKACKKVGDWRLNDATLYVTMEPCVMCAGAIINHRIGRVVIGITEPNFGACGSGIDVLNNKSLGTNTELETGILANDCKSILQIFFENRRKMTKSKRSF